MCSSSTSKPASTARRVVATKSSSIASMSARSMARGAGQWGRKGVPVGPRVGQAPSVSGASPSQGELQEALRPAWPIWIPMRPAPFAWAKSVMRRQAAVCSSV